MLLQKTRQHVLMQRSPRVLPRVCKNSLLCPLLAARGWEQFKTDVINHKPSDLDYVRSLFREGVLESFPQLAIGQVSACQ